MRPRYPGCQTYDLCPPPHLNLMPQLLGTLFHLVQIQQNKPGQLRDAAANVLAINQALLAELATNMMSFCRGHSLPLVHPDPCLELDSRVSIKALLSAQATLTTPSSGPGK
jgi:hypothetical protein